MSLYQKVIEINLQEFQLNLIINWFSYFGSVVNYAIVGASVLFLSMEQMKAQLGSNDNNYKSNSFTFNSNDFNIDVYIPEGGGVI